MMHRIHPIWPLCWILLVVLSLFSCKEIIDIDTDNAPERLIIYGTYSNEYKRHAIRLTRSAGYFETTPPQGVSGAVVTLYSGDKSIELYELLTEPGTYLMESSRKGVEGQAYRLHVAVDFDGDGEREEFEATSYLPYAAQLDSIAFRKVTLINDMIEIKLYGQLPDNEENYFSLHAARNGRLINDSLDGYFIISEEYLGKKEFDGVACFYLNQKNEETLVQPGDEIELIVDVINKDYADFLSHAQSEAEGSIPFFGGPPANIESNFRSLYNPGQVAVSGFFATYARSTVTRVYE
ncbi:hypothetical protein M2137_001112 [Parabacteroides sp. PFB2-10]|uniref:DUF4249 family protein n=1 Tax=Parabacteroides sp. PFB2-10 TaxID=1742405 RepID=UPI002475666C|nr:DUF4249 family protein [Parabacteroides sp. PFB2-10]MDH6312342.1 hypothetical protein [Parabacteroides sp. PFB2-10]